MQMLSSVFCQGTVENIPRMTVDLSKVITAADNVDWRSKGAVTPVKNQQQCGSCWAFSSTGAIEGAWFVKSGKLVSVSEQQLVDCSRSFGNMGCGGGWMDNAFKYVISNKGLCTEEDYPYTAKDTTCHTCTSAVTVSSYVDVPANNLDALAAAVSAQPVAVAISVNAAFQSYKSGVFDATCGTVLNHGVLAVGYGTEGKDFWIVKNSWGQSWGENGYIRMVKSAGTGSGQCGIAMVASYPVA